MASHRGGGFGRGFLDPEWSYIDHLSGIQHPPTSSLIVTHRTAHSTHTEQATIVNGASLVEGWVLDLNGGSPAMGDPSCLLFFFSGIGNHQDKFGTLVYSRFNTTTTGKLGLVSDLGHPSEAPKHRTTGPTGLRDAAETDPARESGAKKSTQLLEHLASAMRRWEPPWKERFQRCGGKGWQGGGAKGKGLRDRGYCRGYCRGLRNAKEEEEQHLLGCRYRRDTSW